MEFFKPFREKYEILFYKDIENSLIETPHYNYIPIIEQLICTREIGRAHV